MNLMTFSPSSKSNSKIDGNQVNFGTVDFQPNEPTLAPVSATLGQEMDLTIGSFNFCIGSLGLICLSDLINSGPSAGKTAIAVTSETSVGSSSKVNSPISMKPMETKGNTIEELDKIMEILDPKDSLGHSDMDFKGNFSSISNHSSKEDCMAYYGNVSGGSSDTWRIGLELYSDEQTIFSSGSSHGLSCQYQVYTMIVDNSEEFDDNNNHIINPENIRRGANHMVEGETAETMATKVKVQLTTAEWDTIKAAVNNGAAIPVNARREVLLGFHYALHRQVQQLMREKSEIRKRRESISAASKAF
jgi:hypothetical protein